MPIETARPLPRPTPPQPLALPFIRRLEPGDREALYELVALDRLFSEEEVAVARELVDGALAQPGGDYRILVALLPGEQGSLVAGYLCYGPTPMTEGTWDLYWVVTHPQARGRGVARALVTRMEGELKAIGARLVRVETSHLDGYGAAHAFYERLGYPVVARLAEFYKPGDDLLLMLKRL